jgi:hypothetical protein
MMTDTSDAEYSAVGESDFVSEGLEQASSFDSEPTSTPDETFDSVPDGSFTESAEPIESIFELDGTPITLDEARNGYLRQSDYTRKTQELAEMRTRLAEAEAITAALQQDPQGTLQALQEAFGVGQNYEADPFADMDPDLARIAVLEQKIAAQESAATQAQIENELNTLHSDFGDFDNQILFAHAIKGGFPNLRAAYADMNFTSLQTQLESLRSQQQQEQQRIEAKRQAASVVHTGSSRSGTTVPAQPEQYGSLRDAYLAAKKALGV